VITLQRITKAYRTGGRTVEALTDVSFHVPRGVFCAVRGPSGCGKSTLLNLIAGLDTPSSGALVLDGRAASGFTDHEWTDVRRSLIGMVFQAFHLLPGLTALENVALPLVLGARMEDDVRARAEAALTLMDLHARAGHRPGQLSGGEQQRVAIARALVHRPAILLADEPTGNLDSRNALDIVKRLRAIAAETGQTVLMATHSEAAAAEADDVISLNDGRLVAAHAGAA
jgi:putative ABC transport system ATP-binding protein